MKRLIINTAELNEDGITVALNLTFTITIDSEDLTFTQQANFPITHIQDAINIYITEYRNSLIIRSQPKVIVPDIQSILDALDITILTDEELEQAKTRINQVEGE